MITSEERIKEFEKDLKELLAKHDAEISLEEEPHRPWMRGEDRMVVTMMNKFDDLECTHEYAELILGRYVSKD
jgi:hypothetical protein